VVAAQDDDRNLGLAQPAHLAHEEEPGRVVLPRAVVEVTGDQHQARLLVDGEAHHALEGAAGSATERLTRAPLVRLQPDEGAIEVDVGGVNDEQRS
jgi:hypothetical protein